MKKIIAFMLFAAILISCKPAQVNVSTVEIKTVTLEPTDVTTHYTFAAKLEGHDADVYPQASGILTEIKVEPGQRVTKGQVLFLIDPIPSEAAVRIAESDLKVAQAQMATAKINLESKKDLYAKEIVSEIQVRKAENEYETSKATVEQAEARLVNARQDLSFTMVKAPSNGVVGNIPYTKGELVGPQIVKPLTVISDNSTIIAKIAITESMMFSLIDEGITSMDELIKIAPDLRLKTSAGTYYSEPGRIYSISGIIDQTTGTTQIITHFPNKGGILRSGGSAKIELPVKYDNVLVIPQAATFEMQDKVFAYKVVDNKATSVEIKVTAMDDGKNYIVLEGLQAGDVIVASGAGNVQEGEEISYQVAL
ncbi:MAG: efflux RND transporter periplasmic adaptor subunit [Bacteroidales bacterium]|nr:efflux RND transporter periplasmic adaptor subunit [Bacteroidales bacterium]